MSDALPLPPRPSLEQYRKLAKDFQHACRSGETGAVRRTAARWAENIARLSGMNIDSETEAGRIERLWEQLSESIGRPSGCTLSSAQFLVARSHGFAGWPAFVRHLEALAKADSSVSRFERAVDAIVQGDIAALRRLLREEPALIGARSTREHRSTLLHYISANGIEDYRQKTPGNIVEIATLLLESGADVHAESDAYGGHSTALGLTATSVHPETAGVQIALLQVLLDHGANIDGRDPGATVRACLRNGRGKAARFLASRGARLDLETAAGVGRLDVMRACFQADGTLKPPATPEQMTGGFAWACEFGHPDAVEYLLDHGVNVETRLPHHGQTGLHWAAHGGHVETVELLLRRGAPVDARDEKFGGTPLGWALHAWSNLPENARTAPYYEVVERLVRSGSPADPMDDPASLRLADKIRGDERMSAALRGEM